MKIKQMKHIKISHPFPHWPHWPHWPHSFNVLSISQSHRDLGVHGRIQLRSVYGTWLSGWYSQVGLQL